METGPKKLKASQLAIVVSINQAIDYLEDIEITVEQKEEVDDELEKVEEVLWKVVETLDSGAGRRNPAPLVRN